LGVCCPVAQAQESAPRSDMKFIVDAHLPAGLCSLLLVNGHEAVHTRELPAGNATKDEIINDLSLNEQRVVISKDTDFYHSHLLHGKPYKLLLVRSGNIGVGELKELFRKNL